MSVRVREVALCLGLVAALLLSTSCSEDAASDDPCVNADAPSGIPKPVADYSGVVVYRDGFEVASWNHEQDGESAGEILVELGQGAVEHQVYFLDHHKMREPVSNRPGKVSDLAPCFTMDWQVADPNLVSVQPLSGEHFGFTVQGLMAGRTTIDLALLRGDLGTELESGELSIVVVDPAAFPATDMDFTVVINGIRELFVIDGALANSCGATQADPGHLNATVGQITDGHYSFRQLQANCGALPFDEYSYHLAFDFDPPNICGIVNHPEHYDVNSTFHLEGLAPGDTEVRFYLFQGESLLYRSIPVPVSVAPAPPEPEPGEGLVRVEFVPIERDETGLPVPLGLGSAWHATPAGDSYRVDELRFYVSAVGLGDCQNPPDVLAQNWYCDASQPSTLRLELGSVEARHWCDVVFTIGLADTDNVDDSRPPAEDSMRWPSELGGGYHYLRIGGLVDDSQSQQAYATGLGRLNSASLSPLVNVTISPHFQLNEGTRKTIEIYFDVGAWYDAIHAIDVAEHVADTRGDQTTLEHLRDNGVEAFELNRVLTELLPP